ncbi:hypothetical protein BY996DRAFT_4010800 [Phakopsora pachyrhizi]|nr:hypothetical protein BY996DRAFT_4010800 [Phakopsora pachyrhizi]
MGKVIINVIPQDQHARLKAKYPNPPTDASPDDVRKYFLISGFHKTGLFYETLLFKSKKLLFQFCLVFPVHDTSKVVEAIKSQPQPPVVVIISNFYPEAEQKKVKDAVEGGAPGIPVVIIPQGLDDEQSYKYVQDEKAKAGK